MSSPDSFNNTRTPGKKQVFSAPQLGAFPPKPNNHIYIPTKDGWVSSLSMSPVRRTPPQTPNTTEEVIRETTSPSGSVSAASSLKLQKSGGSMASATSSLFVATTVNGPQDEDRSGETSSSCNSNKDCEGDCKTSADGDNYIKADGTRCVLQ